jgi:hypothetical protein
MLLVSRAIVDECANPNHVGDIIIRVLIYDGATTEIETA